MALELYEIFWSHFCEKSRWCLDFKRLPHLRVRVNPFTRREARALGARGDVPVLRDGERVVVGSDAIAAYLEVKWPEPPLFPADPAARAEVLALEKRCDELLGPDARRVAYQVALENRSLLLGTLLWSRAPKRWLNGPLLRFLEPRLRRKFAIHPEQIEESRRRLRALLAELQERLRGRRFLVGDGLTLADITAASLMDPLEIVPEFVRDPAWASLFEWKRRLMRAHRRDQRVPWITGPPPPGYPVPDGGTDGPSAPGSHPRPDRRDASLTA
ncbi:MAG TPA: glutathione S-transferase family protein [Candidatus Polarisedimenticolia bacterium]|nr:glutathione S-transferase family protein [Candidatus Polarisedimenticolia bacterium]